MAGARDGEGDRTRRRWWAALLLCVPAIATAEFPGSTCPESLAATIPSRPVSAPTGSQFAASVAGKEGADRERAIEAELLRGNLPSFLKRLKPVTLTAQVAGGRTVRATVCVMPDYLAVGSDDDYLRVPMNLRTATAVAGELGFVLPTRRIVDAVYQQSEQRVRPQPMEPGREMRSTAYYVTHDRQIRAQEAALGIAAGALLAGQKKDVVLSNLLARNPGRIAIYGWHRPDGRPIQPLSTVHGADYADYSHGVRLVSEVAVVDGEPDSVYRVLQDPARAAVLSDEGPLLQLAQWMGQEGTPAVSCSSETPGGSSRGCGRP